MEKKTERGRPGCLFGITAFIVVQCLTLVFLILWQEWRLEFFRSRISEKKELLALMEPVCNFSQRQSPQDHHQTRYRRQGITDFFKDFLAIQDKALETICVRRHDLCIPGPKGMVGQQGLKGSRGDAGLAGIPGQTGDQGPVGSAGDKGDPGPKGIIGAPGATGSVGPRGAKGDAGIAGGMGLKGDLGQKGMDGTGGLKGETGVSGLKGRAGVKGSRGLSGMKGEAGVPGTPGQEKGQRGTRGLDGRLLHSECLCFNDFHILGNYGRNVLVAYGAPLSLHCEFNMKNIPVTWSKDGGPIGKQGSVTGGDLVFQQVLTADGGTYRCSGPNGILGFVSKPVTVVVGPSSKYDCDFESQCSWTNTDWIKHFGRTPSYVTGPEHDHTFANESGHYMYLETSVVNPGSAILQSMPLSAHHHFCLTFWYHMYGASIGSLEVRLKIAGRLGQPLWKGTGSQGNHWLMAKIDLPLQSTNFYVELKAIRGSSYTGDIAVDDIIFLDGHCP